MSVYVDDMRAPFGRLVMCHMIADTAAELHAMAERIGVARRWAQYPGDFRRAHYDICMTKRKLAVKYGAIQITWRDFARRLDDPTRTLEAYYADSTSTLAPETTCLTK